MSKVYQSAASGLGGGAGGGRGGAQLSRATEPSSPSVGRLPATPAHAYTRSPSRVDAVAVARERRVGSAAVKVKTPGKLGISGAAARVPARAMTREAADAYDLAEARRKLSKLSKEAPSPAMRFKARPAPSYTKPRRPDSASAAREPSLAQVLAAVELEAQKTETHDLFSDLYNMHVELNSRLSALEGRTTDSGSQKVQRESETLYFHTSETR